MIWISAFFVLGNLFSTLGWLMMIASLTKNRISYEDHFILISSVITIFSFAFPFLWPNQILYLIGFEIIYIGIGFLILIVEGINYKNKNP